MKTFLCFCALVMLCGCDPVERLQNGDREEKKREKKSKVVTPPPVPVGISEPMVLVDGKWELAKNVEVRCANGQCKPVVVKK